MGALGMQKLCERLEGPEHPASLSLLLADLDHELVRYVAWLETAPLAGAPT